MYHWWERKLVAAATAAKSLQPCLTLCDPVDSSPPGSPVPRILQARTLEWVAISFSKLVAATIKNNREILQVKNYHLFQQFYFCVYIQKK